MEELKNEVTMIFVSNYRLLLHMRNSSLFLIIELCDDSLWIWLTISGWYVNLHFFGTHLNVICFSGDIGGFWEFTINVFLWINFFLGWVGDWILWVIRYCKGFMRYYYGFDSPCILMMLFVGSFQWLKFLIYDALWYLIVLMNLNVIFI